MHQAVLVLPIIVPVFFWAVYHYHKDRHLPEPIGHLVLAFALGALATALSHLAYQALGIFDLRFDAGYLADTNTLALFAYSMLAIGPIEEFAKMALFLLIIIRLDEFDEPLDGIIYASFIGLGFAAIENWQYLEYLTPTEALARGFAGPVIHILFASVWGHYIGAAHLAGRPLLPVVLGAGGIAAVLHGLYDFAVLSQPFSALPCAALLIAAVWIWRLRLMHRMHHQAREKDSAG